MLSVGWPTLHMAFNGGSTGSLQQSGFRENPTNFVAHWVQDRIFRANRRLEVRFDLKTDRQTQLTTVTLLHMCTVHIPTTAILVCISLKTMSTQSTISSEIYTWLVVCVVSYDHLHNNSNVVSEIKFPKDLSPPKRTITLNSPPTPNTTAECPHRGVISAGRVTCRMIKKHF